MATRSSNSSSARIIVGVIITVVIIGLALVSGGEIPCNTAQSLYDAGIEVPDSLVENGCILDGSSNANDVAVEETTSEGNFYTLYFTEPINESDWDLHTGSQVEAAALEAIGSARQTLDAAFFELNMESIAQALINAHNNGVRVRVVVDDIHGREDEEGFVDDLEAAGIEVHDDDRGALMHHKFMVIDGAQVWMGSMNFSHNGIYNNNNNAMLIRSTRLAQNYTTEFEEMFVDGVFTDRGDSRPTPYPQVTIDGVLVENYFSPEDGEEIVARIEELINEADTSIHVMALSLTLDNLGTALVNAHNRGVEVKGIFESRQSTQQAEQMDELLCAGVTVKQDGNPNTFHHKVFVFDGEIVVFGSFNFSASARDDNSENLLIVHDANLAQQFIAEFDRRFADPRAETPDRAEFGC